MNVKVYGYDTRWLYEWGLGYISREKYNAWQKFWDSIADTKMLLGEELFFWRVMKPDDDCGCHMLVTTGGTIYVHPMGGKGVVITYNEVDYDAILCELQTIMKSCAKVVGCSIDVYSKKGVVNYEK